MRIIVIPADVESCGHYRCIWPAQAVQRLHPDWSIQVFDPRRVQFTTERGTGHLTNVQGLPDPDVVDLVVMERTGKPVFTQFAQRCVELGVPVVLDNDDAMWAISRDNLAWPAWNSDSQNWRVVDECARIATLNTVTTDALSKRYGPHVEVIPNSLPIDMLNFVPAYAKRRAVPVVGWPGFTGSHPHDLTTAGTVIGQLRGTHQLAAMPDVEGCAKAWGVNPLDVMLIEPTPLHLGAYHERLASFDIGLVPLARSSFNQAKSWLKALELSAAGCAVVATDTPDNRKLQKSGVPILLAATKNDWRAHIEHLLAHPDEMRERGRAAREQVQLHFTTDDFAPVWAAAWLRAVERYKRLRPDAWKSHPRNIVEGVPV